MNSEARQRFFKYDAFISYAHRDNDTRIVRALHAQLEEFLLGSLDWEPSIWLDERSLDTDADLVEQIRTGLRDSAVLIVVTSEIIESRDWCRNEMGWYLTDARLEQFRAERMYPIFLPFSSNERLPRWVKHLADLNTIVLDPERQELVADQDLSTHSDYWRQLYSWFSRISAGIVAVNAARHELEAWQRSNDA